MSAGAVKLAYKVYAPKTASAKAASNIYIAHGLLGSAQNWTTPATLLSRAPELAGKLNQVYTFDMRNHGASPHSTEHSNAALASDLEAVVLSHQQLQRQQFGGFDALEGRHSILIGHSMGGFAVMGSLLRRYNETWLLPEDPCEMTDHYSKPFGAAWATERRRKTSAAMRAVNAHYNFAETQPIRDILFNDAGISKESQFMTGAIVSRVPKVGRVSAAVVVDITPTTRLGAQRSGGDSVRETLDRMVAVNLDSIGSYDDAAKELLRVGMTDKGMRDFVMTNLCIYSDGAKPTTWRCNLEVLSKQYGSFQPSIINWFDDTAGMAGSDTASVKPNPCTLPILFVFGSNSPYNEPVARKRIAEFFPRSEQVVVDGAGHFVHYEKPRKFLQTILPFLAEHM